MAMAVTHARASGYERVIAGSSGNAGLAVAAFAGAVGLPAVVAGCTWLPDTPAGPLRKLGADLRTLGHRPGARTVRLPGFGRAGVGRFEGLILVAVVLLARRRAIRRPVA